MERPVPSPPSFPDERRDRRRALHTPLTLAAAGTAAFAFVALVEPGGSSPLAALYLDCPSRTLFGVLCPLCGGTRAARALVTGELAAVPALNLMLPVMLALALWGFTASIGRALGHRVPPVPSRGRFWAVLGGIALLYGVLRNLPAFAWLAA